MLELTKLILLALEGLKPPDAAHQSAELNKLEIMSSTLWILTELRRGLHRLVLLRFLQQVEILASQMEGFDFEC